MLHKNTIGGLPPQDQKLKKKGDVTTGEVFRTTLSKKIVKTLKSPHQLGIHKNGRFFLNPDSHKFQTPILPLYGLNFQKSFLHTS